MINTKFSKLRWFAVGAICLMGSISLEAGTAIPDGWKAARTDSVANFVADMPTGTPVIVKMPEGFWKLEGTTPISPLTYVSSFSDATPLNILVADPVGLQNIAFYLGSLNDNGVASIGGIAKNPNTGNTLALITGSNWRTAGQDRWYGFGCPNTMRGPYCPSKTCTFYIQVPLVEAQATAQAALTAATAAVNTLTLPANKAKFTLSTQELIAATVTADAATAIKTAMDAITKDATALAVQEAADAKVAADKAAADKAAADKVAADKAAADKAAADKVAADKAAATATTQKSKKATNSTTKKKSKNKK